MATREECLVRKIIKVQLSPNIGLNPSQEDEALQKQNFQDALNEALQDRQNLILCDSILGTANTEQIVLEINNLCKRNFGSLISSCLYIGFSVGASFGLELENEEKIFVKVHKPTSEETITAINRESLTAVSRVQKSLAESGFPCPHVLLEPTELGNGIATVDIFATPGELEDAHNPEIRRAIAKTLAELVKKTQQ